MKRSIIKFALLLGAVFSISGCFDIDRDIKIYPNGGGVEKMTVTIDKEFFNIMQTYASLDPTGRARKKLDTLNDNTLFNNGLTADVQRTPGLALRDLIITNLPDGGKQISITYIFDDPSAILRVIREATYSISNQLNIIYATLKFFDEGDKLTYKSVIRNASRFYNDSLALSLFSYEIQTKSVTQKIEFPFEVTSSNAQSQADKTLTWNFSIYDALFNQVEMTAEMIKDQGLDITYAEKVDKTIEKVSQNSNPLIRVQVYNANREPVKIGAGVIVGDGVLVTNFELMNIIEGQGYFSVILQNDSLAGVDEMKEKDLVQPLDLVFLRFNNIVKIKTMKFAPMDVKYGEKMKILYYPNALSSVVYSMDCTITGTKNMSGNKVIEVKPTKPLSIESGAIFNEAGEFVGLVTQAYHGEVGKIYAIPAMYIRSYMK